MAKKVTVEEVERLAGEEKEKAAELFNDYVMLARYLAKQFSENYGEPYYQCVRVAEACLAEHIVFKREKYDPEKAKRDRRAHV